MKPSLRPTPILIPVLIHNCSTIIILSIGHSTASITTPRMRQFVLFEHSTVAIDNSVNMFVLEDGDIILNGTTYVLFVYSTSKS